MMEKIRMEMVVEGNTKFLDPDFMRSKDLLTFQNSTRRELVGPISDQCVVTFSSAESNCINRNTYFIKEGLINIENPHVDTYYPGEFLCEDITREYGEVLIL